MPYILDRQTTSELQQWVMVMISGNQYQKQRDSLSLFAETVPDKVRAACGYSQIESVKIIPSADMEAGGFLALRTRTSKQERDIGLDIWLCPYVSPELLGKALELLEI